MLTARREPIQRRVHGLPLHPLLAAAYPVLFLFATNAADQVTLEPLWAPLAAAIGLAAALLLLLGIVLRDWHRAALVVTVAAIAFLGYGHAWRLASTFMDNEPLFLAAWLLLAAAGVAVALRSSTWARKGTPVLNVVTALLVGVNVIALGGYAVRAVQGGAPEASAADVAPREAADAPDIYYLVFDRYASAGVLEAHFGYDNTPFVRELEQRGFYVAGETRANYAKTPLSLVSSLDMAYLDAGALRAAAADPGDDGPIHRRLRGSLAFPAFLKQQGYTYFQIANWWEPSAFNVDADRVFRFDGQSEFSSAVVEMSLLGALRQGAEVSPMNRSNLRLHTLYQLRTLKELADVPGPKFVFAHFLVPHPPYVFERDGSNVAVEPTATDDEREAYLRQLEYTNGQILEVVDRLLARPASERPIIVIQADEGPFPRRYDADEQHFDWRTATDEELDEKFGILNAYHLPGVEASAAGLYPSITPVNSFRMISNAYFGTELPLLPDRVYTHVSQQEFYEFIDVTERLMGRPTSGAD